MPDSNYRNSPKHSVPSDPSGIPEVHDILAAEEFGIGTRDPRFPADPAGMSPPHDILAAEEFAMPVADVDPSEASGASVRPVAVVALGLLVLGVLAVIFRQQ